MFLSASECHECGQEFTKPNEKYFECDGCDHLNKVGSSHCQNCGETFTHQFSINLRDALRYGVIAIVWTLTRLKQSTVNGSAPQ